MVGTAQAPLPTLRIYTFTRAHFTGSSFVGQAKRSLPTSIVHRVHGGHGASAFAHPTNLHFHTDLLHRLQQRDVIGDRSTTHVEDAGEFCIFDLHALGRPTDELHRRHHMHGDAGGADRMAFGL